jgi:hypothetical protein
MHLLLKEKPVFVPIERVLEIQLDSVSPLFKRIVCLSSVKAESKTISHKKAQGDAKGETSTLCVFCAFLRQIPDSALD